MSSRLSERLRHALGFRLALWYALLFVASTLVLLAVTYALLASSLAARDHQLIRSTLERYARDYDEGGLGQLQQTIASDVLAGRHERLLVRVLGPDTSAVFLNVPGEWGNVDLSQLGLPPARGTPGWSRLSRQGRSVELEVASLVLADGTLVQVGKSTESRVALLERFRDISLLVLAAVLTIALLGGAVLTRAALAPVRALIGVVRGIVRTGTLDTRVPVHGARDPLDELSLLFNGMLDRIETLVAGLRSSLDNVAHDLRTPLTRLRGIAEEALRSNDAETRREALARCIEEAERVSETLDTLLDVSEAETGAMALRREPVEVDTLLRDAADLYSEVAEEKGVALTVHEPSGLTVSGDPRRLRQVLANLVDNAVKYTPRGGHVDLWSGPVPGTVAIEVRDDGIGIPEHELPRIFDRLYRGDQSRTERGLGLGLSLARAIVRAHHGEITVASTPGRGSTFTVTLPAVPADGAGPGPTLSVPSALVAPLLLLVLGAAAPPAAVGPATTPPAVVEFAGPAMGTRYSVRVVMPPGDAEASRLVQAAIDAQLALVDQLFSKWNPASELSRFNARRSTEPFPVSPEMVEVVKVARRAAEATGGAFDITVAPLVEAWGFAPTPLPRSTPSAEAVAAARARVGFLQLSVDPSGHALVKARPDLAIDLDGLVAGWVADRIAEAVVALGYEDVLADAGGEITARGRRADGGRWRVAVESAGGGGANGPTLELDLASVATSGDYRKFWTDEEGRRRSHIIDPRSGEPVAHGLASVTVVHRDGAWADALGTGLLVLGPAEARPFAAREHLAVRLLERRPDGSLAEWQSPEFEGLVRK